MARKKEENWIEVEWKCGHIGWVETKLLDKEIRKACKRRPCKRCMKKCFKVSAPA